MAAYPIDLQSALSGVDGWTCNGDTSIYDPGCQPTYPLAYTASMDFERGDPALADKERRFIGNALADLVAALPLTYHIKLLLINPGLLTSPETLIVLGMAAVSPLDA